MRRESAAAALAMPARGSEQQQAGASHSTSTRRPACTSRAHGRTHRRPLPALSRTWPAAPVHGTAATHTAAYRTGWLLNCFALVTVPSTAAILQSHERQRRRRRSTTVAERQWHTHAHSAIAGWLAEVRPPCFAVPQHAHNRYSGAATDVRDLWRRSVLYGSVVLVAVLGGGARAARSCASSHISDTVCENERQNKRNCLNLLRWGPL